MPRDDELQFMDLVGTDVATGSDQEDTFDPGWRYEDRIGMRVKKVEWSWSDHADTFPSGATNQRTNIVLTTRNESALPELNADGVIADIMISSLGITTSGSPTVVIHEAGTLWPGKGLLIVTDRLYEWIDNNSGATVKARLRVWYTVERLEDSDYREAFEVWARA